MIRIASNPHQLRHRIPGSSTGKWAILLAAILFAMYPPSSATAISTAQLGGRSVFKIYVTVQDYDYSLPWQTGRMSSGTGTGFLIDRKRILTNAHIVSNARFIQVQRTGDARRYEARVLFIGHDCDLAILTVDDDTFFSNTKPLVLAKQLPALNDEVNVLGFPLGGNRLSVTRGVVSRLDYVTYSHSGVDQHLALQVDAAINPGNSGGPVMQDRRVVGAAFQGLSGADNIGYAIPLPVIKRFLEDVEDDTYHGYPELGVRVLGLSNPALRAHHTLPGNDQGVMVTYVDDFGAAKDWLQTGDILLSTDGYAIDLEGNVQLGESLYHFAELIERKQWGDSIVFDILRDGTRKALTIPLKNPADPFAYRNRYDVAPEYLIQGGLVFTPLSRNLLLTLNRSSEIPAVRTLYYLFAYGKAEGFHEKRDQYVLLLRRLPHPVNAHLDAYIYSVVHSANGRFIGNLGDLKTAFETPVDGFHVIKFLKNDNPLVLDAAAARQAAGAISAAYGSPAPYRIGAKP